MNKQNMMLSRVIKDKRTNKLINIYIYQPIQEDDMTWFSFVEIGDIKKKIYGIDSIQVIILAISTIREVLLNEILGEYEWVEGSEFLGFPLFVPMFLPDSERVKIEHKLRNEVNSTLNKVIVKESRE